MKRTSLTEKMVIYFLALGIGFNCHYRVVFTAFAFFIITYIIRMSLNLREKDIALKEERGNRLRSAIDGQDQERQRLSENYTMASARVRSIRLRLGALENVVSVKKTKYTGSNYTDRQPE